MTLLLIEAPARKASSNRMPRRKKISPRKRLVMFAKKVAILLLDVLLNHDVVFRVVGYIAQGRVKTIFTAYPAAQRYADAYTFAFHRRLMNWRPVPTGLFRQNGKYGIMFAFPNVEQDFEDRDNTQKLQDLVTWAEKVCRLCRAQNVKFSGRIPGILAARNIVRKNATELDATVEAVARAVEKVSRQLEYLPDTPVILLGGKGYVGKSLSKRLNGKRRVYVVDVRGSTSWPFNLNGEKAILVNLAGPQAIHERITLFWKKLVVINESYPSIKHVDVDTFLEKGIHAYHVVGVKPDFCVPPFPHPYTGGIPCCAANVTPGCPGEVIVKELTKNQAA